MKNKSLELFAAELRELTLEEFAALGFGHVGGAMSVVELLAVLYGKHMRVDPKNPRWEDRDWLVMSKGHAGPAVYAALSMMGFFPKDMLFTLNQGGTNLPSHCDRNKTPGVDMTTGSLGQGISTAIGVALGNRLDGRESYTYFVIGDGECNEGQIWEGAQFAPANGLDHLIGFTDANGQQLDGYVKNVLDTYDLAEKWRAFHWNVIEVDGHSVKELDEAITAAKANQGSPSMIVMHTIKGKGCKLAEGKENNHHIAFKREDMDVCIEAAKKTVGELTRQLSPAGRED